jgi:hypothetical protein
MYAMSYGPTNPLLDTCLILLNEAVAADREAIANLLIHRVECNRALADHPTIQVIDLESHPVKHEVGALGLINGLIERLIDERIASQWSEDGKLIGFVRYEPRT